MKFDNPKIGFVFSTKDRVDFTIRSLKSIDNEGEFDLIWIDGSDTAEGKALPASVKTQKCRIAEIHYNIKGGADKANCFGLRRLLSLGYDYCGFIENDVEFNPGWYPKLMELFTLGQKDGLEAGSVTVRTIESRVLIYRPSYAAMWNVGAGMVLFTRKAARIILATFATTTAKDVSAFFKNHFGSDLGDIWELWQGEQDWHHTTDWAYAMQLHKYGYCSLGSIPSMAHNIDCDIKKVLRTDYVDKPILISEKEEERFLSFKRAVSIMKPLLIPEFLLTLKDTYNVFKLLAARFLRRILMRG
jgi:hypothetical protein